MTEPTPVIVARHVNHTFQTDSGPLPVLRDVNLTLARNTFTCLVGPSGCGKSTLLRIISGLITPTSGEIMLDGEPVVKPHPKIRHVFQQANLMPWRTVAENIALPLELAGVPADERQEAAHQLAACCASSPG